MLRSIFVDIVCCHLVLSFSCFGLVTNQSNITGKDETRSPKDQGGVPQQFKRETIFFLIGSSFWYRLKKRHRRLSQVNIYIYAIIYKTPICYPWNVLSICLFNVLGTQFSRFILRTSSLVQLIFSKRCSKYLSAYIYIYIYIEHHYICHSRYSMISFDRINIIYYTITHR